MKTMRYHFFTCRLGKESMVVLWHWLKRVRYEAEQLNNNKRKWIKIICTASEGFS